MDCLIVLFILICHTYIFSLGFKAWRRAQKYSGEASQTFHFIAVNLCEPLINTFLIPLSLVLVIPLYLINPYTIILVTLPMAILLIPLGGISFQDYLYRRINRQLLLLGLARWGLSILIISTIMFSQYLITAFSVLIVIILYLITIGWGRDLVNTLPGSPASSTTILKIPVQSPNPKTPLHQASSISAVSPPPTTSSGTPTTPLQLPDLSTAIWCSVCHTPTALDADHCHLCGLVFASRLPDDLPIPTPYTLIRPLATGGMSHVYLARDTTDQLVVLKTLASIDAPQPFDWHTDARACLAHEATLLQSLDHPGLPHVHIWLPDEHTPLLVLEHIVGPTLEQTITVTDTTGQLVGTTPLPIVDALGYAHGITQTLIYLTDRPQPIVHGDLKPANLIAATDCDIPVLLDFGSATRIEGNYPSTLPQRYGTPGFAAPEQYHGQVTRTSDVYGLGATLYQLLTADDPSTHPLQFPALATLPPDLADLLTTMLDRDPDRRPAASTVEIELNALIKELNPGQAAEIKRKV